MNSIILNTKLRKFLALDLYTARFRGYDPQLGRCLPAVAPAQAGNQIDPRPNTSFSPYAAMGLNPIVNRDFLGDTTLPVFTVYGYRNAYLQRYFGSNNPKYMGMTEGQIRFQMNRKRAGAYFKSLGSSLSNGNNQHHIHKDKDEFLDWNGPIGRALVPDFIDVGVGFSGIFGLGTGSSIDLYWVTHGPEASFLPEVVVTQKIGIGYSADATINIEGLRYSGSASNITRDMIQTNTVYADPPTIWVSGGVSAGGKIGLTGSATPVKSGGFIYGGELNIGAGLPLGSVPINGAVGISNTWILYDFKK